MGYLFFQTSVWLLIAFIIGLLFGALLCWLCCRNKQQEIDELKQQLAAQSTALYDAKAAQLSSNVSDDIEPEVASMVETMVDTVIESDDLPTEKLEETISTGRDEVTLEVSETISEKTETLTATNFFTEPPADVDDLKRIKGIGAVLEKVLNELGVYQFKQIAQFTKKDVDWVNESLSFPGRIEREEWIDQAQKLSEGKTTEFSKRVDKGDVEY